MAFDVFRPSFCPEILLLVIFKFDVFNFVPTHVVVFFVFDAFEIGNRDF